MNAIEHTAGQMMNAKPLKAAAVSQPLSTKGLRPCISSRGQQIEALHRQGMKLVDIAREIGINYNGLRGLYSQYRRAKAVGRI